ncbi:hypothetical protein HanIR_Chr16g0832331 [Helianthus annuus]|nr:hypothetical protein HanIR_Chr16g0832331 [Helianthus annuus]
MADLVVFFFMLTLNQLIINTLLTSTLIPLILPLIPKTFECFNNQNLHNHYTITYPVQVPHIILNYYTRLNTTRDPSELWLRTSTTRQNFKLFTGTRVHPLTKQHPLTHTETRTPRLTRNSPEL